ncbi:hypothetical protein ACFL35_11930 [Candidatus Riflebacteria bacterium]
MVFATKSRGIFVDWAGTRPAPTVLKLEIIWLISLIAAILHKRATDLELSIKKSGWKLMGRAHQSSLHFFK